jgi:hypothetical protein
MHPRTLFPLVLGMAFGNAALAASPEYMLEDCKYSAKVFFQEYEAGVEAKYEGQRADGTHAVNGTIQLETRGEDFQCSYNAAGDTLVGFVAEGKPQPTFVSGGGSPHRKR